MAGLREALKGDDASAISAKTNALQQASIKLGEAVYAQSQKPVDGASQSGGDNVVDAEFTEVEDDDKKKST